MEFYIDDMLVKFKGTPQPYEASTRNLWAVAKVRQETKPSEMHLRSQFRQVFGLYGNLERNRGQSHLDQSGNGLSSSYHPKRSTTTYWLASGSQAVLISFYKSVETIFYDPKGIQTNQVE